MPPRSRKLNAMKHALGHMLNRQLSRGWGAWTEMALDRAAFMHRGDNIYYLDSSNLELYAGFQLIIGSILIEQRKT